MAASAPPIRTSLFYGHSLPPPVARRGSSEGEGVAVRGDRLPVAREATPPPTTTAPRRAARRHPSRGSDAPRPPLTPWMAFVQARREAVTRGGDGGKPPALARVMQAASAEWRAMGAAERELWQSIARADRERLQSELRRSARVAAAWAAARAAKARRSADRRGADAAAAAAAAARAAVGDAWPSRPAPSSPPPASSSPSPAASAAASASPPTSGGRAAFMEPAAVPWRAARGCRRRSSAAARSSAGSGAWVSPASPHEVVARAKALATAAAGVARSLWRPARGGGRGGVVKG